MKIIVNYYFDYKSPYAFLADDYNTVLSKFSNVELRRLPFTLEIKKYLGEAELDANGQDILNSRNDHQWRRVKYSYMDCRREANKRNMTILGPKKIFDSRFAHASFLWASQYDYRCDIFHQKVFSNFWSRDLDIENIDSLIALLVQSGIQTRGFMKFLESEGFELLESIQRKAENAGVFGVPSWLVNGTDLYWGLERLGDVEELVKGILNEK